MAPTTTAHKAAKAAKRVGHSILGVCKVALSFGVTHTSTEQIEDGLKSLRTAFKQRGAATEGWYDSVLFARGLVSVLVQNKNSSLEALVDACDALWDDLSLVKDPTQRLRGYLGVLEAIYTLVLHRSDPVTAKICLKVHLFSVHYLRFQYLQAI
jgi:hypothetical protein